MDTKRGRKNLGTVDSNCLINRRELKNTDEPFEGRITRARGNNMNQVLHYGT